jgi:hypothetical protein
MASANTQGPRCKYKNYGDILRWHGLFALLGYWLCRVLRYTPSRLWFGLPKRWCFLRRRDWIWNEEFLKATPCWHDIGVLILVGVTGAVIWLAWSRQDWLTTVAWWTACLLLIDMLAYHISVLWFDDLGVGESTNHRKVWSHRRILFQTFINFIQSVFLFAVLYHGYQSTSAFWPLHQDSFTVATTFTRPASLCVPMILADLQVCVSIFFLVLVIGVFASIAYNRPELGKSFDD